ncbi:Uncharacterised protein [Pseudomonas aeruginosa]|nr:Uncharacterised protein [Pseudomonas aeruginosa]
MPDVSQHGPRGRSESMHSNARVRSLWLRGGRSCGGIEQSSTSRSSGAASNREALSAGSPTVSVR